MNRNLSQIITGLFAQPVEGKEPSSQIQRLGDEVRKVFHSEDTLYGKFLGLLESFRAIIPDEKQRYQAALQALSTTSKLNRREIITAINVQLEELKILEKGLMPSLPGWRDGTKTMEAGLQQLKGELAQLRERLAQLEVEEKTVQAAAATRQMDLDRAEKSIGDIFADIVAEIISLSKKVAALPEEAPVSQPSPAASTPPSAQPSPRKEPVKSDAPGTMKADVKAASPQQDTKFQRKCPMCRGPFHLLELEKKWQCFTCAYEEPATDAVQATNEEMSEPTGAPTPTEVASSSSEPESMVSGPAGSNKGSSRSGSHTGARKKSCPVCFKKLIWYPGEKVWRCSSGHYERR